MQYKTVILGTGGTGGILAKEYGQFLYSLSDEDKAKWGDVLLIDGDIVEKKNLVRQPFIEEDIGKNKAEVLAEIINMAYGTEYRAFGSYITSLSDFMNLLGCGNNDKDTVYVLCGCVDNHQARSVMDEFFHCDSMKNVIYLDSANEYSVGEVVTAVKLNGIVISPTRTHYYPDIYDSEESRKKVTDMSCEELNTVAPQHKITNMLASNILLGIICKMIQENHLRGGITYFDAFRFFVRHDEVVLDNIKTSFLKKCG